MWTLRILLVLLVTLIASKANAEEETQNSSALETESVSPDLATSAEPAPVSEKDFHADLAGSWDNGTCTFSNEWLNDLTQSYTFSETEYVARVRAFHSKNEIRRCYRTAFTVELYYTYEVRTSLQVAGSFEIDSVLQKMVITPQSDEVATRFTQIKYRHISHWKKGQPVTFAGKDAVGESVHSPDYNLLKVVDDKLYLGDRNTGDSTSMAERPNMISEAVAFPRSAKPHGAVAQIP